jgi:hypothetical protein
MFGQFDLITLIALVVAVAAIIKLRNVLGHRTDEDEQRVERLKTREREAGQRPATETASADIISMPRRDRDAMPAAPAAEVSGPSVEARIRAYPTQDTAITAGLLDIAKLDPTLDPDTFLTGAGRAN